MLTVCRQTLPTGSNLHVEAKTRSNGTEQGSIHNFALYVKLRGSCLNTCMIPRTTHKQTFTNKDYEDLVQAALDQDINVHQLITQICRQYLNDHSFRMLVESTKALDECLQEVL